MALATQYAREASAQYVEVSGFVLAGGRSTRMGQNKALLELSGEVLIARAVRKLADVCGTVTIAGGGPELAAFGQVLPDAMAGCGPLSGIVRGLEATAVEWGLFLAVDLPLIPERFLEHLCARAIGSDAAAIMPVVGGVPQPLCAVYRRSGLNALRNALDQGHWKVRAAAEEAGRVDFFIAPEEQWFLNANTPEEWDAVVEIERASTLG